MDRRRTPSCASRRRWRALRRLVSLSLRDKLRVACLLLTAITVLLGAFAQVTQNRIGAVGVRMYDRTFMAMSYLRASQNGLLKLRAAIEHADLRPDPAPAGGPPAEAPILKGALLEIAGDLRVALDRAVTAEARRATEGLSDRLDRLAGILAAGGPPALLAALDEVQAAFDTAVEIFAADGFNDRREVETLRTASEWQTLLAVAASVLLATAISYGLARSVLPPIRQAAAVAGAISAGKLDNRIRVRGRDEVSRLLRALAAMQSSLVEKIGHIRLLAAEAQAQAAQLRVQNGRFEGALDNMIQGLCMFDAAGRLVVHNRRFEAMFGAPARGATPGSLGLPGVPEAAAGDPASRVHAMPDGRVIAVSHGPITDGGWVCTYEDVTERHRIAESLERMARTDGLTQLPNRTFLRARLEAALAEGCRPAVLCLDLDGFKAVNDTLGHAVGDGLLRAVAQRLLGCAAPGDVVGRLGGDEFAVIRAAADPAEVDALAACIVRTIGTAFVVDSFQVTVGISIGIAREDGSAAGSPADRAAALLKNADVALYRAKVEGRGTFRHYAAEMDRLLRARRDLERDLRGAIEGERFALHFQPLVDARDGSVCCFEALLRWEHPERGMVPPAAFVPIAEETGLIRPIGRWALQQACRTAAAWPDDVRVAVNISPVQFQNRLLGAEVVAALNASGLAPRRLELEITESALIMEDEVVLDTLHQLRGLGVRIALDDFGTGYASLSYLRRFPFDKIKIDRSFVSDLAAPGNLAIVRAVIGLGRALEIAVVGEGVETGEQRAILAAEGCTELQGYHLGPPRPAGQVHAMLDRAPLAHRRRA